jgi:DNA-binding response OmpR family regulator
MECGMRALIIEDNPTSLMLLKQLVSRVDGCEAATFSDPTEALSQLDELEVDIVLVDYMMPTLNGIEVIRRLRAAEGYQTVPIVMVTAENEKETRLEAFNAGATDFLVKPIEPIEFKARVRNLLALRQAENVSRELARELAIKVAAAARRVA